MQMRQATARCKNSQHDVHVLLGYLVELHHERGVAVSSNMHLVALSWVVSTRALIRGTYSRNARCADCSELHSCGQPNDCPDAGNTYACNIQRCACQTHQWWSKPPQGLSTPAGFHLNHVPGQSPAIVCLLPQSTQQQNTQKVNS